MTAQQGETWRFQVHEPGADRVFLVRYGEQDVSLWTPMERIMPGVWQLVLHLDAGSYRFGYFTCQGSAYFNGGAFGLSGERVSEPDPEVEVAPLPPTLAQGGRAADAEPGYGTSTRAG